MSELTLESIKKAKALMEAACDSDVYTLKFKSFWATHEQLKDLTGNDFPEGNYYVDKNGIHER